MTGPRYLVWVNSRQFYYCSTLAEACDWRKETGGLIYEPLGATEAEKIEKEPAPEDLCESCKGGGFDPNTTGDEACPACGGSGLRQVVPKKARRK